MLACFVRSIPRSRASAAAVIALTIAASVSLAVDARAAPPWIERPLTLPEGVFAFDLGLGVVHATPGFVDGRDCRCGPPIVNNDVGLNVEMAVGLTSRIELGIRTGVRFGDDSHDATNPDFFGRPFDQLTFDEGHFAVAQPEIRLRGAIVRARVVELGLEARVVVPLTFSRSAELGLLAGVPVAFHLGERVRIDTGLYTGLIVPTGDVLLAVIVPVDVWIQATPRFWLGPIVQFDVSADLGPDAFGLGLGLGYSVTHAVDLKASFYSPEPTNTYFGAGIGLQIRTD